MSVPMQATKEEARDAWLPITASRNGNSFSAAFQSLCTGIGVQALMLPFAFEILGWTWGIISLTMAFAWQLYTLWLLVRLHESTETGKRYSRYLHLFRAAFGNKMGMLFALFPIIYLSAGTCVAFIVYGGEVSHHFFETICGHDCRSNPLSAVEWQVVFTSGAVLLSQLPTLNSFAGVSLVGSVAAVGYSTIMWVLSVSEGRFEGWYPALADRSVVGWINAFGLVAFAFRGHNLTLEIQGTMPSRENKPSKVPMWRGAKLAYLIVPMCLYPIAIAGHWAHGPRADDEMGILGTIYSYYGDASPVVLGAMDLLFVIHALSSFQIYAMPMQDAIEAIYVSRRNQACPWWLRMIFRAVFCFVCFFFAVMRELLGGFAGVVGGIALPVTFAYPCFMWLAMKKPRKYSLMWWVNWVLGLLGLALSITLFGTGVYDIVDKGVGTRFFKFH